MSKGPGGIISGGFQPLKAPDAPTIDSVSAGVLSADVTFSAPADTGAGSVDSYVITAKQSDGTSVSQTASAAGTASVTLTTAGTTTFAAQAISNAFGPGQFSGFSNSTNVFTELELYSWGSNAQAQLGLNDTIPRSSPVQISSAVSWLSVSSARDSSFAIKSDGTLWSWGENNAGQLGLNEGNNADVSSPTQVGALTNWSKISAGREHALAVKSDGTLWAWGLATNGRLGNNNNSVNRSSPVQVGSDTDWSNVIAGRTTSFAIDDSGKLYAWGRNNQGYLGLNDTTDRSSPVQVGALTTWQTGSADSSTLFINTSGEMFAWGFNVFGAIGNSNTTNYSSPVQVGSDSNWDSVFVNNGVMAKKTDGTLWSWGYNGSGQLGHNDNVTKSSPTQIGALTNWNNFGINYHSKATKTDGTLWTWGRASNGENGDETTINHSSPVQVGSDTDWDQLTVGNLHALVFRGVV